MLEIKQQHIVRSLCSETCWNLRLPSCAESEVCKGVFVGKVNN